jgi:hypothetical protein
MSEGRPLVGIASDWAPGHHPHLAAICLLHGYLTPRPSKPRIAASTESQTSANSGQQVERTALRIWLTSRPAELAHVEFFRDRVRAPYFWARRKFMPG